MEPIKIVCMHGELVCVLPQKLQDVLAKLDEKERSTIMEGIKISFHSVMNTIFGSFEFASFPGMRLAMHEIEEATAKTIKVNAEMFAELVGKTESEQGVDLSGFTERMKNRCGSSTNPFVDMPDNSLAAIMTKIRS